VKIFHKLSPFLFVLLFTFIFLEVISRARIHNDTSEHPNKEANSLFAKIIVDEIEKRFNSNYSEMKKE